MGAVQALPVLVSPLFDHRVPVVVVYVWGEIRRSRTRVVGSASRGDGELPHAVDARDGGHGVRVAHLRPFDSPPIG